jgi:hypothetical protein
MPHDNTFDSPYGSFLYSGAQAPSLDDDLDSEFEEIFGAEDDIEFELDDLEAELDSYGATTRSASKGDRHRHRNAQVAHYGADQLGNVSVRADLLEDFLYVPSALKYAAWAKPIGDNVGALAEAIVLASRTGAGAPFDAEGQATWLRTIVYGNVFEAWDDMQAMQAMQKAWKAMDEADGWKADMVEVAKGSLVAIYTWFTHDLPRMWAIVAPVSVSEDAQFINQYAAYLVALDMAGSSAIPDIMAALVGSNAIQVLPKGGKPQQQQQQQQSDRTFAAPAAPPLAGPPVVWNDGKKPGIMDTLLQPTTAVGLAYGLSYGIPVVRTFFRF